VGHPAKRSSPLLREGSLELCERIRKLNIAKV